MIEFNTAKAPLVKEILEIDKSDKEIDVVKFRYLSAKGNEIYTVLAYPKEKGTYPGLLVLHGGTQNAEIVKNRVELNARNGYISMAPELPVIANPTENSIGDWTKREYVEGAFENTSNPLECSLYETVSAACDAFLLMENINTLLPENIALKDKSIGLTGFSWGGYMVTMLCSIFKERVKAGFSNYGCGFYDLSYFWSKYFDAMTEENKNVWLENYDVGRRAKDIISPYFIASPANDMFFNPPAVMKTLETVSSKNKSFVFSPNSHHCIEVPGGTSKNPDDPHGCAMEKVYFDYYLKNIGEPFFSVKRNKNIMTTDAKEPNVSVYYSDNKVLWTERKWKKLDSEMLVLKNNEYIADVPKEFYENKDFYFLVTDERNVSVSSDIFQF